MNDNNQQTMPMPLDDPVSAVLARISTAITQNIDLWQDVRANCEQAATTVSTTAGAFGEVSTGLGELTGNTEAFLDIMLDSQIAIGDAVQGIAGSVNELVQGVTESIGELVDHIQQVDWEGMAGNMSRFNEAGGAESEDNVVSKAVMTAQELQDTFDWMLDLKEYATEKMAEQNFEEMISTHSLYELVDAGYLAADAFKAVAEARELKGTFEAGAALDDSLQAQARAQEVLESSKNKYEAYKQQLNSVEAALVSQMNQLDLATAAYAKLVESCGETSQEAEQQRDIVEELTSSIQPLVDQQELLNKKMKECDPPDDKLEKSSVAAKNAKNEFDKLLESLKKTVSQFVSLSKITGLISDSMSLDTYELRFQAMMGVENGSAASAWAKQTALAMGRDIDKVMESTMNFAKLGLSGQQIEGVSDIANRLAWFSDANDYGAMSNAIQQALQSGKTDTLASAMNLSKADLKGFGLDAALEAGNLDAFVSGLEQAAEAAGMTAEALEAITQGPEAQWETFTTNLQTMAQMAAGGFMEAFGPVLEMMNEWLESDSAQVFFEGLYGAFMVAGQAAALFVQGLMVVADYIADNFTAVMTGVAALVAYFAGKMLFAAITTAIANAHILLLVGIALLVGQALQSMGLTAADIFEGIGQLAGMLYAVIYNAVASLYNIIATFAEFFMNVFDDPVGAAYRLFYDVFDVILGIVETVAGAIDSVLNTNMAGAVSGFRTNMKALVKDTFGENEIKLDRLDLLDVKETSNSWGDDFRGIGEMLEGGLEGLMDGLEGFEGFEDLGGNLGGSQTNDLLSNISDNTANISDTMEIAEEDLKYMLDIAEREAINKYTTAEITVNQTNNNQIASDMDVDGIISALSEDFAEMMYISAEGVHA